MSDADSGRYRIVPIHTRGKFPRWEIQVIFYITDAADNVRVIERRPGANNVYADLVALPIGGPRGHHVHRV
jgi:hypothetical protein